MLDFLPNKNHKREGDLEHIRGQLMITDSVDELLRPLGGAGFFSVFTAHATAIALFALGLIVALLMALSMWESDFKEAFCFSLFFISLLTAYALRKPSPPARVEEQRFISSALSMVSAYFPASSYVELDCEHRHGFKLQITDARSGEMLTITFGSSPSLLMSLTHLGAPIRSYSSYASVSDPDRSEDEILQLIQRILANRHAISSVERSPVERSAVELNRTTPHVLDEPPAEFSVEMRETGLKAPSRAVARLAEQIYRVLFIGVSLVALVVGAVSSIMPTLLDTLIAFGVLSIYGVSLPLSHDYARPAHTTRRSQLPFLRAVYELRGSVLSAHLLDDPSDRASIDLQRPFSTTFTRSSSASGEPRVSLELRQAEGKQTHTLRLTTALLPQSLDAMEMLPEWREASSVLDADDFISLCAAIEFYAQAEGGSIGWWPSLPTRASSLQQIVE